ncbi:MAG: flagellar protein FlaG [Steroidobacter sp.]
MVNSLTAIGVVNEPSAPSAPAPVDAAAKAVAQATEQAAAQREPTMAEVKQAARQLETFMESMNRYLEFRVDQDSGRTVVTVKDKTTGDVVRQIPTEEVLRLAHNLGGKGRTGLLNQTA